MRRTEQMNVAVFLSALVFAASGCGKPPSQNTAVLTSRKDERQLEVSDCRNALVKLLRKDAIRLKLKEMGLNAWEHVARSLCSEEAEKRLMTARVEEQESGEVVVDGWWIDIEKRTFRCGQAGKGYVFAVYGHFEQADGEGWNAVVDTVSIANPGSDHLQRS